MNPQQQAGLLPEQIEDIGNGTEQATVHDDASQPCDEERKKNKTKEAVMLRCALCSAIPLGSIGICAILFGVMQIVLRPILHEIGYSLIGVGGILILISLLLFALVAYLPVKIKRREEQEWKTENADQTILTQI